MYKLNFSQNATVVNLETVVSEDGKEWKEVSKFKMDADKLPDDIKEQVLSYGLLKLVQDRNSGLTVGYMESDVGLKKGSLEAVEARVGAYQSTYDMFIGREWKKTVERARGGLQVDAIVAQVVTDVMHAGRDKKSQVDVIAVTVKLKGMQKEERAALKAKYSEEYKALKTKQMEADDIDLSGLFDL